MKQGDLNTREQIISMGVRLFGNKGYTHTGMEEIAKEVGISKPAIYYHFENKEKLFCAIMETADQKHKELLKALAEKHLDFPDLIEDIVRNLLYELKDFGDWFRMFYRLYFTSDIPQTGDLR